MFKVDSRIRWPRIEYKGLLFLNHLYVICEGNPFARTVTTTFSPSVDVTDLGSESKVGLPAKKIMIKYYWNRILFPSDPVNCSGSAVVMIFCSIITMILHNILIQRRYYNTNRRHIKLVFAQCFFFQHLCFYTRDLLEKFSELITSVYLLSYNKKTLKYAFFQIHFWIYNFVWFMEWGTRQ